MPLHEWAELPDWESVHHLWISELFRSIKSQLPAGYRASLGTVPALTIGTHPVHPDIHVRQPLHTNGAPSPGHAAPTTAKDWQPDTEVAVLTLDPQVAVQITVQGRLVAALELISPRNKDRREARLTSQNRYLGYLMHGVHLLLIDVHRLPTIFSFADALAEAMGVIETPCPAPLAVSYRVGDVVPGSGRVLSIWRRPLTVGATLPIVPLPISLDEIVEVDLEATYQRAAADAYLDS